MVAHNGILGTPDSGDTAFIIICSALVLMMTLPGLMLFYGALAAPVAVFARVCGGGRTPRSCAATAGRRREGRESKIAHMFTGQRLAIRNWQSATDAGAKQGLCPACPVCAAPGVCHCGLRASVVLRQVG
jgi:hypothetical protein